jgi:hypothetical protein
MAPLAIDWLPARRTNILKPLHRATGIQTAFKKKPYYTESNKMLAINFPLFIRKIAKSDY